MRANLQEDMGCRKGLRVDDQLQVMRRLKCTHRIQKLMYVCRRALFNVQEYATEQGEASNVTDVWVQLLGLGSQVMTSTTASPAKVGLCVVFWRSGALRGGSRRRRVRRLNLQRFETNSRGRQ